MKAILFDGKKVKAGKIQKPRLKRRHAVVRIRLAGICSTDLEIARGYMDFKGVPGHEFVGTVVSASPRQMIGKRVVGEINIPCGKCSICRRGMRKHCPNRSVIGISKKNGAFAEFLAIPLENLHLVPSKVSDEEAVFAELLAAACEVPARIKILEGNKIAVLGDGRLAAMVAQVLSLASRNVSVLGLHQKKLAVFRGLGIPAHDIARRSVFKRKFDIVVECTGRPTGLPIAAELVRPEGTIVLKSTYHGCLSCNLAPIVIDEITIVGSRCGPIDTALRLLALGHVKVTPFLTAIYPFEKWRQAFRRARHPDSFKVLIEINRP